ncbi:MAG: polysaccharide deacetylase family protein [Elusimicrobia bacterium]|nr:polysaccharide deacetylase family protein [Elusimicrobiota bacterium]
MTDVPVLVTYDIHIANYSVDMIRRALHAALAEHERIGLRATFFFPAEAARLLSDEVGELVAAGHEIGCHGLTHRPGELYDRLPPEEQRERLRQATIELEDVVQDRVRAFRAPAFRISGPTLRALEDLGYEADLSMNSQRLGLLSSDVWNVSWLVAPRLPYHPDERRPWRAGRLRLWEIPLSCFVLPFMSMTMLVLGARYMRWFFRALLAESRISGKPIVFMTHPEELLAERDAAPMRSFRWRDLLPSEYGFQFRYRLVERDPAVIADRNRSLFDHMRSVDGRRFVTAAEYVRGIGVGTEAGDRPVG